eukprot:5119038-Pleurochrysis_carterae.AAC.1
MLPIAVCPNRSSSPRGIRALISSALCAVFRRACPSSACARTAPLAPPDSCKRVPPDSCKR